MISERLTASFHGQSIWFFARPAGPERFGLVRSARLGVDRLRQRPVRQAVGEHEGNALARGDGEFADGSEVLAVQLTDERSTTMSGPAIARRVCSSMRVTHGTVAP